MTIKRILILRDGISAADADDIINDAKERLQEYLDNGDYDSAFYICEEFFGLEPDYNYELIDML